jgi:hypothetical protein
VLARRVYIYRCDWIKPPHPKIFLCVDGAKRWGFFFNSEARRHGIGQIECGPADCAKALTKACYLDASGLKAIDLKEAERATEFDVVSQRLYDILIAELTGGNDLLSDAHRLVVLNVTES